MASTCFLLLLFVIEEVCIKKSELQTQGVFMRTLFTVLILLLTGISGCAAPVQPQVIFSEIAWAGTGHSAYDEWIELYNGASVPVRLDGWRITGAVNITLKGVIPAKGWFLLERSDDRTVPGVAADQIYRGGLPNRGANLLLLNRKGQPVDRISMADGWQGGSAQPRRTMQRVHAGQSALWKSGPDGVSGARNSHFRSTPASAQSAASAGLSRRTPSTKGVSSGSPANSRNTLTVASFNIQILGDSKVSRPAAVKALAAIITNYDIVAVQELRDKDGSAAVVLLRQINLFSGNGYKLISGLRLGRSSSKEQYLYYYRTDTVKAEGQPYTWKDSGDRFEREPFIVKFRTVQGNFDFVLINIHTKPRDAAGEIAALAAVARATATALNESDIIVLGDFNADGRYYNERRLAVDFRRGAFYSLIPDSADTTVARSSNTYDRVVVTAAVRGDYTGKYGVYRLERVAAMFGVPVRRLSDHYPVWVRFYSNRDQD